MQQHCRDKWVELPNQQECKKGRKKDFHANIKKKKPGAMAHACSILDPQEVEIRRIEV
jgi:hypothetical protein